MELLLVGVACEEVGPEPSPDYVPYEWVEVVSFMPASGSTNKVVVRYDENTTSQPRDMYIHFYNGKWGLVGIHQAGKTE